MYNILIKYYILHYNTNLNILNYDSLVQEIVHAKLLHNLLNGFSSLDHFGADEHEP